MNKIFASLLLGIIFISCKSGKEEKDVLSQPYVNPALQQQQQQPAGVVNPQTSTPAITTTGNTVPAPVVKQNDPATGKPNIVQSQPAQKGVALNPPHGQPGHRCDIQVGAPLTTAPAQPATTQPSNIQVSQPSNNIKVSPVVNTTTETKAAPGVKLNPPHGQPGHDCTIGVGQPLKN